MKSEMNVQNTSCRLKKKKEKKERKKKRYIPRPLREGFFISSFIFIAATLQLEEESLHRTIEERVEPKREWENRDSLETAGRVSTGSIGENSSEFADETQETSLIL